MSKYNYNVAFLSGPFEVCVDTTAQYGYFEHQQLGDECGGGLWFEGNVLTDFDGVSVLPGSVADGLREHAFVVGEDFT